MRVIDITKILDADEADIRTSNLDLIALIENICTDLKPLAIFKNLKVEITAEEHAGRWFMVEARPLEKLLRHLIYNAIKLTDYGSVQIKVTTAQPAAIRLLSDHEALSLAEIEIFDPSREFKTVGAASEGAARRGRDTLAPFARTIVSDLGGDLEAECPPARGGQYRLTLPLQRSVAQLDNWPETAAAPSDSCGLSPPVRCLIVDDNALNRHVLELLLEPLNYQIIFAENGLQAVQTFETDTFDLVLMDNQMPVMDGMTAIRQIRALEALRGRRPSPIAMVSADVGIGQKAAEAGANAFVSKPIFFESLMHGIDMAVASAGAAQSSMAHRAA